MINKRLKSTVTRVTGPATVNRIRVPHSIEPMRDREHNIIDLLMFTEGGHNIVLLSYEN